jgi:hypothetical protein
VIFIALVHGKVKSKAIPVTDREGLLGCEMLRSHTVKQSAHRRQQDCQPYATAALYSPETFFVCFWYSFLLEAE